MPPINLPKLDAEGVGDRQERPQDRWKGGTDTNLASFYVCYISPMLVLNH